MIYSVSIYIIPLPSIIIQANINLIGLITTEISIEVDFSPIAALVRAGTELSYNETTSGGVVTAAINIGVAADIDLSLNAVVIVKLLGLVQIGMGNCVITFIGLTITIDVIATFAEGDASNCKMKQITANCSKLGYSISSSGNSNVDAATTNSKDEIVKRSFTSFEDKFQEILDNCVEV